MKTACGDLLAGTVDAQFDLAPLLPHIAAGKLRAIAVTSDHRMPSLPNVPTIAESGYPSFAMEAWNSLVAPAGTPKAIVDKLQQAVAKAVSDPSIRGKLTGQGYEPGGGKAEARRLHVPLLAQIPIEIALRQGGDEGRPLVATNPDSLAARAFLEMARKLA